MVVSLFCWFLLSLLPLPLGQINTSQRTSFGSLIFSIKCLLSFNQLSLLLQTCTWNHWFALETYHVLLSSHCFFMSLPYANKLDLLRTIVTLNFFHCAHFFLTVSDLIMNNQFISIFIVSKFHCSSTFLEETIKLLHEFESKGEKLSKTVGKN